MSAAEMVLDRDMQTAFVAWEGRDGTVPSEAVQKIREGQQHPWRVLARRFMEARDAGVPLSLTLRAIRALDAWVRKLYGASDADVITYHQGPRFSGPFTRVA